MKRYIHTAGYIVIAKPSHPRANKWGLIYEHVLVAEKKLKRSLLKGECTHHIDGNRTNNHPDNITTFASRGEHNSFHLKDRHRKKTISLGGNPTIEKHCSLCNIVKPFTSFSPNSCRGKKRLSSHCKECSATEQRNYRTTLKYKEWYRLTL